MPEAGFVRVCPFMGIVYLMEWWDQILTRFQLSLNDNLRITYMFFCSRLCSTRHHECRYVVRVEGGRVENG